MKKLKSEIYKGHKVDFIEYAPGDVLAILHIRSTGTDVTECGRTKTQAFRNLKREIKGFTKQWRKYRGF